MGSAHCDLGIVIVIGEKGFELDVKLRRRRLQGGSVRPNTVRTIEHGPRPHLLFEKFVLALSIRLAFSEVL